MGVWALTGTCYASPDASRPVNLTQISKDQVRALPRSSLYKYDITYVEQLGVMSLEVAKAEGICLGINLCPLHNLVRSCSQHHILMRCTVVREFEAELQKCLKVLQFTRHTLLCSEGLIWSSNFNQLSLHISCCIPTGGRWRAAFDTYHRWHRLLSQALRRSMPRLVGIVCCVFT